MALQMVSEDAAYRCASCGHVIQVKKGQLLPPCTRCGGAMEKHEGSPPPRSADAECR